MGDKVEPRVIKKTQDTLGKIVKKPPLTEKLLSKPPFRFLHDVMTSTIKSTGFMKGLFTDSEMNSENVKEKDAKIAFLQKVIDMISLVTGKPIAAKPSKIVAGQEPDRTNELLQGLAEAVNKKVDNDDYVRRVLKGGDSKPPSGSSKKDDRKKRDDGKKSRDDRRDRSRDERDKKESSSSRDKSSRDKADREKSGDRRDRDRKDRDRRDRDRSRDKDRERSKDKDRERSKDKDKDREDKDKDRRKRREEKAKEEAKEPEMNGTANTQEQEEHVRQRERERSSKSRERTEVKEDDLPPQVTAARKMARPSSARPAPPKVKKNEAQEEPVMMGSSNVPNLIQDKDSSDEDDGFMAKEEEEEHVAPPIAPQQTTETEEAGEHGSLVKKILETKKELEGGNQTKKTEIERSSGVSDATRRKERELIQKEIEKLRTSIQTLTRSVNPLGKILDFLQEDLDSMQKELVVWQGENRENAVALQREQSITESSVEPLKAQLTELDSAIGDQLDLIAAVKHNTIRNDERIEKMLSTVTKS